MRLTAAELPGPATLAAVAGTVALAAGLVLRTGTLVTLGLGLLGSGYGFSLSGKGLDPAAAVFAAGLAVTAELAFWALEPGAAVRLARAATVRRVLAVLAVALAAALGGALLLAAVWEPLRGGAALGVAGLVALVVMLAVVAVLARPPR